MMILNADDESLSNLDAPQDGVDALLNTVVRGGYCVGCGACAALRPDRLQMKLDSVGRFEPSLSQVSLVGEGTRTMDPRKVCPFAEGAANEDIISAAAFPDAPHSDEKIGRWESLYAGHVAEGQYRENGSSGGMTSWIAAQLLERQEVDAVIHVKPTSVTETGLLFQFAVSRDLRELRDGAKTRYYPCEISHVLEFVRNNPGRYAIVALPCFSKAVRLLRQEDKRLGERIKYQIAIVCGHLKSTAYAEYYGWNAGISPRELKYVDFRHKSPMAKSAKQYFIQAQDTTGRTAVIPNDGVYGTDWGLGVFKLKACDYCDDVLGETADITLGDAWLPQYDGDPMGTNIIVVRNAKIDSIVRDGLASQQLVLDQVTSTLITQSQSAGFRHRRDGLAYRLWMATKRGVWHPPKRTFAAEAKVSIRYRWIFRMRERLRDLSHLHFSEARQENDLAIFRKKMQPMVSAYFFVQRTLDFARLRKKVGNRLHRLVSQRR